VRDLIGSNDAAAAYAVQQQLTALRIAGGANVVGRKIGLTSAAVQAQLGVDQPDFGVLFDDMAYADGDTIPFDQVLQPRVEAEVAFLLRADLESGDLSVTQVRGAVEYAVAALEICGSRVRNWDISFGDTVADNASAGAFVLGNQPRTLDAFDPSTVSMTMTVTGQDLSTGSGSACLGDPLLALRWLARQARDLGAPLRAGQIILSGALGPMRSVAPGAEATATISGLGDVSVRFSNETSDKDA
jgi:2-keto-4-pentenoate hydratase